MTLSIANHLRNALGRRGAEQGLNHLLDRYLPLLQASRAPNHPDRLKFEVDRVKCKLRMDRDRVGDAYRIECRGESARLVIDESEVQGGATVAGPTLCLDAAPRDAARASSLL